MDRGDNFILIDVREPHEYQIARIPGSRLIPLGELPKRLNELDPDAEYRHALQERHAQRQSRRSSQQTGFKNVRNMKGGILAWSDKVDPTVPKY